MCLSPLLDGSKEHHQKFDDIYGVTSDINGPSRVPVPPEESKRSRQEKHATSCGER